MSNPIIKFMSAMFLSQEEYRTRYPAPVRAVHCLPAASAPNSPPEDLPHMFVSGGVLPVRMLLLNRLIEEQRRAGRAVVVLQAGQEPLHTECVLSVSEGGYDPVDGATLGDACGLLCDVAQAMALEPAPLYTPLEDELRYILERDGRLSMAAFLDSNAREIGADAFIQGRDPIAESHAIPASLYLDYLRNQLRRSCRRHHPGRSIRRAAASGQAITVKLPQGSAAWMGAVLAELQELCLDGTEVFVILCGVSVPASCRGMLEQINCGQCLCYPDLPAMDWLWNYACRAANCAMMMRHTGPSAKAVSGYFHEVERDKVTRTTGITDAHCDSGGFMGLFGSNTVSDSSGTSITRQWEARFSADGIAGMKDNEGLFVYNGQSGSCRIN